MSDNNLTCLQKQKLFKIKVKVKSEKCLPSYATKHSAGADLKACITEKIVFEPGTSILVPTGLYLELPENFEAQIRPRSGLALKYQITVLNTPGTIDADYRGEVGVILINHSQKSFTIEPFQKIAQMVISPVVQVDFQIEEKLSTTQRGSGGFGHSGL